MLKSFPSQLPVVTWAYLLHSLCLISLSLIPLLSHTYSSIYLYSLPLLPLLLPLLPLLLPFLLPLLPPSSSLSYSLPPSLSYSLSYSLPPSSPTPPTPSLPLLLPPSLSSCLYSSHSPSPPPFLPLFLPTFLLSLPMPLPHSSHPLYFHSNCLSYTPQGLPLDFHSPAFYNNRRSAVDERLQWLESATTEVITRVTNT